MFSQEKSPVANGKQNPCTSGYADFDHSGKARKKEFNFFNIKIEPAVCALQSATLKSQEAVAVEY
jgi:hypothetical protein